MVSPTVAPARAEDRAAILRLDEAVRRARGHPALGESVWRDIDAPRPASAGFLARTGGGEPVAYLHIAPSDTFSPSHWAAGLAVDPEARLPDVLDPLVAAAIAHVAARSGGQVLLWLMAPSPAEDEAVRRAGFRPDRDLLEMRVALPLAEEPAWPAGITIRDFEPGRDEAAWLEVNNRAFANHPEQGGWVEATLRRRMAEPWFDPSLFVLAFDGRGLAGFDWLKVHPGHRRDPDLGEIFVIGVDPRMQGSGLGRALAVEGMRRVAARGIATGTLFVAADNIAARGLYESLGFTVQRVDRAYAREVPSG